MKSSFSIVAAVCALAGLLASRALAQGQTIQVMEPQTGHTVTMAHVSVLTSDGRPLLTTVQDTGVTGEGIDLDRERRLDPRWRTLVLYVQERGIRGTMRVHYEGPYYFAQQFDAAAGVWKPGSSGAWAPDKVYAYNDRSKTYEAADYRLAEESRLRRIETAFFEDVQRTVRNAVDKQWATVQEGMDLDAAVTAIVRGGLKAPLAQPEGSLPKTLADLIEKRLPPGTRVDPRLFNPVVGLLEDLVVLERTGAPKPPTILSVPMERPWKIPVAGSWSIAPFWPCPCVW